MGGSGSFVEISTVGMLGDLALGFMRCIWFQYPSRFGGNVAPDLMEGFGLMKSFRGIIQNQLLFEGFGIMKSFWDRKLKK